MQGAEGWNIFCPAQTSNQTFSMYPLHPTLFMSESNTCFVPQRHQFSCSQAYCNKRAWVHLWVESCPGWGGSSKDHLPRIHNSCAEAKVQSQAALMAWHHQGWNPGSSLLPITSILLSLISHADSQHGSSASDGGCPFFWLSR